MFDATWRLYYLARHYWRNLIRRLQRRRKAVDRRGPVFISYRQSDGWHLAEETAWALRSAGVPVWRDEDDLPPGDTEDRLGSALSSGLSGAVLIVTPEIHKSTVVRNIEVPELLWMAESSAFTLSIGSTICGPNKKLNYEAPDRLLQLPMGVIKRMQQRSICTPSDRSVIARAQAVRRVEGLREDIRKRGYVLTIDLQTRLQPFAEFSENDLVVRLRPPAKQMRSLGRASLEDFKDFLTQLPRLLAKSAATAVQISGRAHLSVAFAFGAALPTTSIGDVVAVDTAGDSWSLEGCPGATCESYLEEISRVDCAIESGPVAVFLDLLPSRSDAAYLNFVEANRDQLAAAVHIRPKNAGPLQPNSAGMLVADASNRIREAVSVHKSISVHLFLRTPWPISMLLGRTLNTLRVHLYEWETGPIAGESEPCYVPSLLVSSGSGNGPIESVVCPDLNSHSHHKE